MNLLEINPRFVEDHIEELIKIEDYVPISFKSYNAQEKRDDFLRSKNLLNTMRDMNELVRQKCNYADDSVEAYNSVLIEWVDCHPEFEKIIATNSYSRYCELKDNNKFIRFVKLLSSIVLPSEKKEWVPSNYDGALGIRDDSTIQLPHFEKIDDIFDKYGATLLSCYLSYLV